VDIDALARLASRNLPPVSAPPSAAGLLRLDSNTSLFGPNPAIRRVLEREAAGDFAQYPASLHDALRAAIAAKHGLDPDEVLVGAGADELIDVLVRAFVNPGETVAVAVPTFELYAFCARLDHATVAAVPLGPGFSLDVDALAASGAKLTFVASPNNPTGNAHPAEALERLVRASRGVVVIDEAYAEFCGQDFRSRVRNFPNLAVLRTFSKAYALAGLRVGYAVGGRRLIDCLVRVKMPFTVGALSERIALEALADDSFVRRSREIVDAERPWLTGRLSALGLHPYPTDANFMLVDAGARLEEIVKRLFERKIAVRSLPRLAGGCLRVTIGRREDNERLVAALSGA
jgi:histidinol-phosphate aminotransferase